MLRYINKYITQRKNKQDSQYFSKIRYVINMNFIENYK